MRGLLPATDRLWSALKDQRGLAGFTLIGGSALTLRIGHRISEDLDFVWSDRKLPRPALEVALHVIREGGFQEVERDDDNDLYDEFLIAGMSIHDYQQNFIVDGVKLQFFAPEPDLARLLAPPQDAADGGPRVAELREIFDLKCLAAANRCVSRDALDLFVLLREHGFTMQDFARAFEKAELPKGAERAFANLTRETYPITDPGYEVLMDAPPSRDELRAYFSDFRDEYEIESTSRAVSGNGSKER